MTFIGMESILWRAPLVYRAQASSSQDQAAEIPSGVLTETSLRFSRSQSDIVIALDDILQAEVGARETDWRVLTYSIKQGNYVFQDYAFNCSTPELSQRWVAEVNNAIALTRTHPEKRSLTVLINPSSGSRKSRQFWESVRPIFEQAHCQLEIFETKSSKDLRNQVHQLNLSTYNGLVILGGDGSIFHGVNGLMSRPDWEGVMTLPLGFIPTGTSNGLVKSILDAADLEYSARNAAIAIAMGHCSCLDLIQVEQDQSQYFSILSLSWGFFSDLDIQSDQLKFLGFFKNYLYTLLFLLKFKSYQGTVEIKSDSGVKTITTPLVTLWMMNVAWAAYNFKPSPKAQLNDGYFDVWITAKTINRWQFLKILLKAFDGEHLSEKGVDYYKATALKITPQQNTGIFAVDGEEVAYRPISLEVFPRPLKIFAP